MIAIKSYRAGSSGWSACEKYSATAAWNLRALRGVMVSSGVRAVFVRDLTSTKTRVLGVVVGSRAMMSISPEGVRCRRVTMV